MSTWQNKVAVVTGGANGIGYSIAERFLAEGMRVVLADIDNQALDSAVASLGADSSRVLGVRTDISLRDDMINLANVSRSHFGSVHVLINNAGVNAYGYTGWDTPPQVLDWVFRVNFFGTVNGVQTFLPTMIEANEGHIINVGSTACLQPKPHGAAYGASKHAILGFTETVYYELAEINSGVRLSMVLPRNTVSTIRRSAERWPAHLGPVADSPRSATKANAPVTTEGGALDPSEVAEATWSVLQTGRFLTLVGFGPDMLWNRISSALGVDPSYRTYWGAR